MDNLKEKLENYCSDDFNHQVNPYLDEVLDKVKLDVKEAVLEDIYFFNICKEHILKELKIHSNKTSYNIVERFLDTHSIIKNDIFGDFEK